MVGLIQKLLLDLVRQQGGPETVQKVKQLARVPEEQEFSINEVYDDKQWQSLLAAACDVLHLTPDEAEQAYATYFFEDAKQRWPMWFTMAGNAREFLEQQPTIHNGFAVGQQDATSRDAINDKFKIESLPAASIVRYESPNALCGLYKALVNRVLDHYGEVADIDETQCAKQGAGHCIIRIRWPETNRQAS